LGRAGKEQIGVGETAYIKMMAVKIVFVIFCRGTTIWGERP